MQTFDFIQSAMSSLKAEVSNPEQPLVGITGEEWEKFYKQRANKQGRDGAKRALKASVSLSAYMKSLVADMEQNVDAWKYYKDFYGEEKLSVQKLLRVDGCARYFDKLNDRTSLKEGDVCIRMGAKFLVVRTVDLTSGNALNQLKKSVQSRVDVEQYLKENKAKYEGVKACDLIVSLMESNGRALEEYKSGKAKEAERKAKRDKQRQDDVKKAIELLKAEGIEVYDDVVSRLNSLVVRVA